MEIVVNNCQVVLGDIDSIISHKKKLVRQIHNLKLLLEESEESLAKFQKYLATNCEHEWVVDSIDSIQGYKEGQLIKYCENCELSFPISNKKKAKSYKSFSG